MSKLIKADFHGDIMQFRDDGWFNATVAAAKFEKEPFDWLNQRDTVEYIATLADRKTNSCFLKEFNEINKLDGTSAASKAKLLRLAKKTGFVKTESRTKRKPLVFYARGFFHHQPKGVVGN